MFSDTSSYSRDNVGGDYEEHSLSPVNKILQLMPDFYNALLMWYYVIVDNTQECCEHLRLTRNSDLSTAKRNGARSCSLQKFA